MEAKRTMYKQATEGDAPPMGGLCSPLYETDANYRFWENLLEQPEGDDDNSLKRDIEKQLSLQHNNHTPILQLLQCGSLEKDEDRRRLVVMADGGPCRMFLYDEEEEEDLYELSSEASSGTGDSFHDACRGSATTEDDDIVSELHEEIPYMRERSEILAGSSKYKTILATSSKQTEDDDDSKRDAQRGHERNQKKKRNFLRKFHNKNKTNSWRSNRSTKSNNEEENEDDTSRKSRSSRQSRLKQSSQPSTPRDHQRDLRSSTVHVDGRDDNMSEMVAIDSVQAEKTQQYVESSAKAIMAAKMSPISESRETLMKATHDHQNKLDHFQLDEVPPTSRRGRNAPPVSVIRPTNTEADDLIRGMSTLTTEGGDYSKYMQHNQKLLSSGRLPSKMCMPPLLMKLKNIKLAKNSSSLSRAETTTSRTIVNKLGTIAEASTKKDATFEYDHDTKKHCYVAFFRRGPKAAPILRSYEHPIPPVFPTMESEVVVRIEASTVSSTDLQIRQGDFWGEQDRKALKLPIIPGITFSGVVIQAVNNGYRTGMRSGDRVIGLVRAGANARHISIDSDQLVKVPEQIRDSAALSTLPEIYLSAFQALHLGQKHGARYRKTSLTGKVVLVLGGATSLGRALVELALAAGCGTVYATGKQKQYKDIQKMGGAPLGRDPLQWSSILQGKVDLVVGIDESIGKTELQAEHMPLLTTNGKVVLLCAPDLEKDTVINLEEHTEAASTFSGRKIHMLNLFDSWEEDIKPCKRDLTHLVKLLADGSIRPKILEKIPLSKVAKAQDLMEGKKVHGFIICEPWMTGRKHTEIEDDEAEKEQSPRAASKGWSPFQDKPSPKRLDISTSIAAPFKTPLSPLNEG